MNIFRILGYIFLSILVFQSVLSYAANVNYVTKPTNRNKTTITGIVYVNAGGPEVVEVTIKEATLECKYFIISTDSDSGRLLQNKFERAFKENVKNIDVVYVKYSKGQCEILEASIY